MSTAEDSERVHPALMTLHRVAMAVVACAGGLLGKTMGFLPHVDRTLPAPPEDTLRSMDPTYYDLLGDDWWDEAGPCSGLHGMNPVRARYFANIISRHIVRDGSSEVKVLDIGCGAGILAESIAKSSPKLQVHGVDVGPANIAVASSHGRKHGLTNVSYSVGSAYDLSFSTGSMDVCIMSDLLAHLHDAPRAVAEACRVLKPGGLILFDNINRTAASYYISVVIIQKLLRIVPKNTHDWKLFVRPHELAHMLSESGVVLAGCSGLVLPVHRAFPILLRGVLGINPPRTNGRGWGFVIDDADKSLSYIGWAVKT